MAATLSGSDEDLYAMACHQAAFTVENSAHENYICNASRNSVVICFFRPEVTKIYMPAAFKNALQ